MELITNYAYVRKPPIRGVSESFQVDEHIHIRGVTHPNSLGTDTPAPEALPDLILVSPHLAIHLHLLLYPLINW